MAKLDERDIKILALLQQNGRMSSTELAAGVNLSVSPCWKRVKRLESEGLIQGYAAQLSAAHFDLIELLVTIELSSHAGQDFRRFETYMKDIPEVIDLWAVGGGLDYVSRFACTSLSAYQTLIDRILDAEVGLYRYFTYAITKTVKSTQLPIDKLVKTSD